MKTLHKTLYGFSAAVFFVLTTQPSLSGEHSSSSTSNASPIDAPDPNAPQTLQLSHIIAPALTRPGSYTTSMRAMTPILVVPHEYNTPLVCQRAPRITEALLRYFLQSAAPVDKKHHIDSDALAKQSAVMAAFVNKAIGLDVVSDVYIIEGGKAMSTGVAARLPFANATGCGAVLEHYEQQVQEMLKK